MRKQRHRLGNAGRGLNTCAVVRHMAVGIASMLLASCATNLNTSAIDSSVDATSPNLAAAGQARAKPVTIAMILPLAGMGRAAIIGKSLKQAGELALFESGNPAVQLIVKNDDGNAAAAGAAAQQAIAEGAEIIVGPLFGASVPSVAAPARAANIPVVALSNDRTVAGSGVYLISDLPEAETERIVSFAIARGKRSFAALIPAGPYGDTVERAFRSAVTRGGGRILASERFSSGANAMLKPAKRIFEVIDEAARTGTPVDALFIPGSQENLPTLGTQMAYANVDTQTTQLLGLSGWEYPNIGRDKIFVGGWYTGQDPMEWQAFAQRFAQTFGQTPPRVAARAYEAVSLAISLSGKPKGQRFTQGNLTMPTGFAGVNGRFALNIDGTSRRNLAILAVQDFGSTRIDDNSGAIPGRPPAGRSPLGLTGSGRPLPAPRTSSSSASGYPASSGFTSPSAPL